MTKEALKLALEALNSGVDAQVGRVVWTEYDSCLIVEAITAIKEALAQPEPWEKFCDSNCVWTDHHPDCKLSKPEQRSVSEHLEPVAWMDRDGDLYKKLPSDDWHPPHTPLYTTPPQRTWVGLTEQERNDMEDFCEMIIGKVAFDAIEAKLKEKNT